MPVKCLNDFCKKVIAQNFLAKTRNQTELAIRYGVSRRTIQRVLIEQEVLATTIKKSTPSKPDPVFKPDAQQSLLVNQGDVNRLHEDSKIINIVRSRGLNHVSLELKLDQLVKRSDVEVYLARVPRKELSDIMYVVGKARFKQYERLAANDRSSQEAANG